MFTYIHTRRGIHKSIYFYTHTHTYEKYMYTTHINTHILTHAHTRTHTEMRSTMAKYHMPANPCVCNTATQCNAVQHEKNRSATHCNSLQLTATHCNSLQLPATHTPGCAQQWHTHGGIIDVCHTATHCNSLQHTRPTGLNNGEIEAAMAAKASTHITLHTHTHIYHNTTHKHTHTHTHTHKYKAMAPQIEV